MRVQSPSTTDRGSAGFTLIELVVVMVLMGVMAVMIIPEMRGTHGDAVLRSGGRELANVCAIAASRAVSFNQTHRVNIDPGTRRFRVEKRMRSAGTEPLFEPVRDVAGCEGELHSRVSVRIRSAEEPGGMGERDERNVEAASGMPGTGLGNEEASGQAPGQDEERTPSQAVTFYTDGTADRREIVLTDAEGFGLILRINPVTARVRVLDMPRK